MDIKTEKEFLNNLTTIQLLTMKVAKNLLNSTSYWLSGTEGEGEYFGFLNNGNIWEHCFWKNGELHGKYKRFWDDGNIMIHNFYQNGELHGEYKIFGDNGNIMTYQLYENGK